MRKERIWIFLPFIFFFNSPIGATGIGCNALLKEKTCHEPSPLKNREELTLSNLPSDSKKIQSPPSTTSQVTNITPRLKSIEIQYQGKRFLIEREGRSCPPFCIQPMKIEQIETIGELETLSFIEKMQQNKNFLLIDARSREAYKNNTIPSAINIPAVLLEPNSQYRSSIIKLLGGKILQKKWYFRTPLKLLIFDNGILDNQSSRLIHALINVGYPQSSILYYRGGIQSWQEAGLTLF